ncbi:MAG: translocation/assembly module TamB domain-containing protein, partial [Polyangiaceae bacterium]
RRYSSSSTGTTATAGASARGGVWRITLHAYGDADNLRLEMTSEPALSQEDIVLLLTVGMTRAEVDQLATSGVGGSAALEALSSITGADSAVKKAVPVIDEFRFGSAYSSRTGRSEATVTVGKRVTDQVRANVTSGLLENREIRSNLEWKLTPRVSVQGSYDNVNDVSSSALGNLGADVRWRLEFE